MSSDCRIFVISPDEAMRLSLRFGWKVEGYIVVARRKRARKHGRGKPWPIASLSDDTAF